MKALCVTESRNLELRDVPSPSAPPPSFVNVKINAAAVNHGDITFLRPRTATGFSITRLHDIWGASAVGTITEIGPEVPTTYLGRKVAVYSSLQPAAPVLGLWCETAQTHYLTCLLLPDHVDAKDYSGSLVNVATAYAFLDQASAEGHRGVIVTAGGSATGRALAALARKRGIPALFLVRSERAKEELLKGGVEAAHVLNSGNPDFLHDLEKIAGDIGATAVFDGIGGTFLSKILRALPPKSTVYFYGFLSGTEKVEFNSALFMFKNLTMKRFSNFESETVKNKEKLAAMLKDLEGCIEDPMFRTSIGKDFQLEEADAALEYKGGSEKAVFVLSK